MYAVDDHIAFQYDYLNGSGIIRAIDGSRYTVELDKEVLDEGYGHRCGGFFSRQIGFYLFETDILYVIDDKSCNQDITEDSLFDLFS